MGAGAMISWDWVTPQRYVGSVTGLGCLVGRWEGYCWHQVAGAQHWQELRQPSGMALALLLKESTARTIRLLFHHTNICWDGAAAPDPLCAYPGHRAGGWEEKAAPAQLLGPTCPSAFVHIPGLCCHGAGEAKDVPGDGGSLWEVLEPGLDAARHPGGCRAWRRRSSEVWRRRGGWAAGEPGGAAAPLTLAARVSGGLHGL